MRLLPLSAALLAAAIIAACGGGGLSVQEGLQRMVLQASELPEGLSAGDESFTTNDDLAAASADPGERKAMLESWGRLLGFEIAYRPSGAALDELPLQGVNVSASLYRTEEGASESFADAVETAEETDWRANYAGLTDFRQDEVEAGSLAEEIVWLRLSGFQPADSGPDSLVTDDLIFFREGRERGFLRVLAGSTATDDRGHYQSTVEGWLEALVDNVRDVLPQVEEGE